MLLCSNWVRFVDFVDFGFFCRFYKVPTTSALPTRFLCLDNRVRHRKEQMASEKQLTANRANARRSTGPKTATGKARARSNAVKHGLTAQRLVIAGEDPTHCELFCAEIESEWAPETEMERRLAVQLAGNLWRLRRVSSFEAGIFIARAGQVTPEQTFTLEEFRRAQMKEIAARFVPPEHRGTSESEIEKVSVDTPEATDPNQLFWRKIGVALTRDSQLFDALANLSRHEGELLRRVARTSKMLSTAPRSIAKNPVAGESADSAHAEMMVMGDEDPVEFERLRTGMLEQHAPCTRIECELLDYIAGLVWRLGRLPAFEAALIKALRDKIAPEERDPEEKRKEREAFEKVTNEVLKKYGRKKDAQNDEASTPCEEYRASVADQRKHLITVAGLVLIGDSQSQDGLGKLSRHESDLTKWLSLALQLLALFQTRRRSSIDADRRPGPSAKRLTVGKHVRR